MQNSSELPVVPPDESVLTKTEMADLRDLIIRIDKLHTQNKENVNASIYGIPGLMPVSRENYTRTNWNKVHDQRILKVGQLSVLLTAGTNNKGVIVVDSGQVKLVEVLYEHEKLSEFGENAISGPWWEHVREYMARLRVKVVECEQLIENRRKDRLEREQKEAEKKLAIENARNEQLRKKYREILNPDERGSIMRSEQDRPAQKGVKRSPFESLVEKATPEYIEGINNWWESQRKAAEKAQGKTDE